MLYTSMYKERYDDVHSMSGPNLVCICNPYITLQISYLIDYYVFHHEGIVYESL